MWSLSSIPTEAAWSVLKRDGGLGSLPPELQESMQSFYEQIPDEQREKIEMIAQAVEQMEPEKKHKIQQMMMITLNHNADKLPEIFNQADPENIFAPQQSEPGTFKLSLVGLGHEFVYGKQSIRKAIPLLVYGIGAIFAADGINQSQGANASFVGTGLQEVGYQLGVAPEPDWGKVTDYGDSGFGGDAVFQEPFLGIELGRVENASWWQSGLAAGMGALQGFSPVGGSKVAAKASTKAKGKASRFASKVPPKSPTKGLTPKEIEANNAKRAAKEAKQALLDKKAKDAQVAHGKSLTPMGKIQTGAKRGMHRLAQATIGDPRAAGAIKDIGAAILGAAVPTGNRPNIHGTASANPSAGGGGSGVGGVGNRASMGQGNKQIWSGALEQQRGGGYGTQKGDNMKIGEQILKEVDMRIHKAHCGTTHKADCPTCGKGDCKCKDSTKKGSKKPAHGMVIIIGSKDAGPGPSKNGKRVKKD